jgi:hypothetical protein
MSGYAYPLSQREGKINNNRLGASGKNRKLNHPFFYKYDIV